MRRSPNAAKPESPDSTRCDLDQNGSSSHPDSDTHGARTTARRVSLLGVVGIALVATVAPACHEFDTTRELPARGSVGQEMYGVLCDRVAAQALREDLTGASFRSVCHKPAGGEFADKVDRTLLPPLTEGAVNTKGEPVSVEKQRVDRDRACGKIEALARRRDDLIRALDATFPADEKIPIKDLDHADPTKSCDAPAKSGEGLLTEQLADMLGRMGELYTDGTLPQSTSSLARVVDVFQKDEEAQKAWQRISARQGYRPIETALGVARPMVAYPHLRELSNASLRLLSADSKPYELNPQRDADGNRVPIAGPANAAFNKMLEVAHEELLAVKPDDPLPPLVTRPDPTGRVFISRPRDNIEMLQQVLFTDDDAFVNGPSRFIVRRDSRGYARVRNGEVPAPFLDANDDGLPDVDEVGNFKTANGSLAPSPFAFAGSPEFSRDGQGRAIAGGGLLYDYIDTSRTFAAQMMKDMKPLVNSDPAAKHETLMDMMGGLPIMMGPRETRTKTYADGVQVSYDGIRTKESPMLDVMWALGTILGDQTADLTLSMSRELFTTKSREMARVTGAINTAFDIAQKHDEAKIPRESTFWDEQLDIMAKLVKEPGLLEDVLAAFAAPESQNLGVIFSKFASFKDHMTYDRDDINGPALNLTTKSKSDPKTPVDRGAPITGDNRSALMQFLKTVSDTVGVAACNKPDAKLHVDGLPDIPFLTFKECEVFKIDDLGVFYVDSIGDGYHNAPANVDPRPGTIFMRKSVLSAASSGSLIEASAGILGMYPTGGGVLGFGTAIAPTPRFLNRLVFFDLENDTKNQKSNTFIKDLQGEFMGTAACPERIIDDPAPDAKDARPDGKVRGLRNCADGEWLQQRNPDGLFPLESFGFYDAIKPLVSAFVAHGREDLFLELSASLYKHFPGPDASVGECKLPGGKDCPRDDMVSYEGVVSEAFGGDVVPALGELTKALETLTVKTCKVQPGEGGVCPENQVELLSGIQVAAAATRALLDPDRAKAQRLTDRAGNVTTTRNDGTTVPQVTPAYLLTNALLGIDLAFDKYEEQNPNDKERRAGWRRARSQLVDQFLGVSGIKSNSSFKNPSIPKMTPVILDLLRSQLWAHCPNTFAAPLDDNVAHPTCEWARKELVEKASDSLAGPLATTGIDVMDAMRKDPEARREMNRMMEYLVDAASQNDALGSVLASTNDMLQILRDDENLIPLLKVAAAAVDGSTYDDKGRVKEKSLVDAQMALLARMSGKYFDKDGKEICRNEVDPNQVIASVLARVVTPIKDGDFKGQTPLEVIIDVVADVNREDPTQPYDGTLRQPDYANMSKNVVEFLVDPQRGLEQFYEVVRNGLK
ncbi:MAG: hypothetical protein KIT84_33285 [Labilithrix sp.]|nr:hypothetical protein [Labilithrix sp.]MCW5815921.1 hypothetical protein [Labilithrix sp.]